MADNGANKSVNNTASSPKRGSGQFGSLMDTKRGSGVKDVAHERRQSLIDQSPSKPGFIGSMWNNWVRGSK